MLNPLKRENHYELTKNLVKFSNDELCEIYYRLAAYKWNGRTGRKHRMRKIQIELGARVTLRWLHVDRLGWTEEKFDKWLTEERPKMF